MRPVLADRRAGAARRPDRCRRPAVQPADDRGVREGQREQDGHRRGRVGDLPPGPQQRQHREGGGRRERGGPGEAGQHPGRGVLARTGRRQGQQPGGVPDGVPATEVGTEGSRRRGEREHGRHQEHLGGDPGPAGAQGQQRGGEHAEDGGPDHRGAQAGGVQRPAGDVQRGQHLAGPGRVAQHGHRDHRQSHPGDGGPAGFPAGPGAVPLAGELGLAGAEVPDRQGQERQQRRARPAQQHRHHGADRQQVGARDGQHRRRRAVQSGTRWSTAPCGTPATMPATSSHGAAAATAPGAARVAVSRIASSATDSRVAPR